MLPKHDLGGKFADPVAGSSRTARCKYCGKVMYGGVTRLEEHIAQIPGHVEPCRRAPRKVSLIPFKLWCESRIVSTETKRKGKEHHDASCSEMVPFNMDVLDPGDDIIDFDDFLTAFESCQLKHVMEESHGMGLMSSPYISPSRDSCSRQFSSGGVIIDEDNDGESELKLRQFELAMEEIRKLTLMEDERLRQYSDPRSSKRERKQLTQAMEESRYMAIMAEERREHFDSGTSANATSLTETDKMQFNKLQSEKMKSETTTSFSERPLSGVHTTKGTQEGHCDEELAMLLHKNGKLKYEIEELKKQLAEKDEQLQDVESLNQILILKERTSNEELQDARKKLIHIMLKNSGRRKKIGVKRMGEVDEKSFQDVCSRKFRSDDWEMRCMELCSLWQDKVNDPNWQPFKKISRDGKWEETINEDDNQLKELKLRGVAECIKQLLMHCWKSMNTTRVVDMLFRSFGTSRKEGKPA